MRTIVVTGSASGMGAATKTRLEAAGDRVIGVDIQPADVVADLGTVEGRRSAINEITEQSNGVIDGPVSWAGAGISLNAVVPGAVETAMTIATRADPVIGEFVDSFPLPVGRLEAADELAAFVEFLLGPNARFFCGSILYQDGGTDALLRADAVPTPWNID